MGEEWRAIPGCEECEVSNHGRVRNAASGRVYACPVATTGYHRFVYNPRPGKRRAFAIFVHRAVMLAFVGPCPPGKQVNHRDGVKTNNRLDNLEYVTGSENMQHAARMGLAWSHKGERHCRAKLTEEAVREIRALVAAGEQKKAVAKRYGVSAFVVREVVGRRSWKHVA